MTQHTRADELAAAAADARTAMARAVQPLVRTMHEAFARLGAVQARQDGHTGACEATSVPGDPSPTEAPTGRQAGAQRREEGQP